MSSKVPELTKMLDIINKLKNPDLAKQEKEKKENEFAEQQTSQAENIQEGEEKTMPEKQQQKVVAVVVEGAEQTLNQPEQMIQDGEDETPKDNALQGEHAQKDKSGEPEIQQPPTAAGQAANADAAPAFGAAAAENETDANDDSSDSSDMVTDSEMSDDAGAGDNKQKNKQTDENGLAGKAINGNDDIDHSQSEESDDSSTYNSEDFDDLLPATNPNFFDVDDHGHVVIQPHNGVNELHEASISDDEGSLGCAEDNQVELAYSDPEFIDDNIDDSDSNAQGDGQVNGDHGGPHFVPLGFDVDMEDYYEDEDEAVEGVEDDYELDFDDLVAQYAAFGVNGHLF